MTTTEHSSDLDDHNRRTASLPPTRVDSPEREVQKVRETKPSLLTTEFWLTAGGIGALVLLYLLEDDPTLDLFRACLLGTILVTAYVVSRGLAKSGSRTQRMTTDAPLR